jgi:hypothetical protein
MSQFKKFPPDFLINPTNELTIWESSQFASEEYKNNSFTKRDIIRVYKNFLLPNEEYCFAYFETILLPKWNHIIAQSVILVQNKLSHVFQNHISV